MEKKSSTNYQLRLKSNFLGLLLLFFCFFGLKAQPPLEQGFELKNALGEINNGFIRPDLQGIQLPATYQWSNGATTRNIFNLFPGTYQLSITDFGGQIHYRSYEVHSVDLDYQLSWNFQASSVQHSIYIPGGSSATINGQTLQIGDKIGAFYDSSFHWVCAGFIEWTGIPQFLLVHGSENGWGGFETGESFRYLIHSISSGKDYPAVPTYFLGGTFPNDSTFAGSGNSGLISLSANSGFLHSVKVYPGYNDFFSIYPILNNSPSQVFQMNPAIYLISNNAGNLYWPQPGLSNLPPIETSTLYRATMYEAVVFSFICQTAATPQIIVKPASCYNTNDAYIYVSPPDANLAYEYEWNTGSTTSYLTGINPDSSYHLSISFPTGSTQSMVINSASLPAYPNLSITTTNASSTLGGSIQCILLGSNWVNSSFTWSNGFSSTNLNSLQAGFYLLELVSPFACLFDTLIPVYFGSFQPEMALFAQVDLIEPFCFDSCNGSILINTSGGTPPYQFQWSNGSSTESINEICTGNYQLQIDDVNTNQFGSVLPWLFDTTLLIHTIIIPSKSLYYNGLPISPGAQIGVFYEENGQLFPAGQAEWQNLDLMFIAYGDNPITPNKEGFFQGESFVWQVSIDGTSFFMDVEYSSTMPNQGDFYQGGTSRILSLSCIQSEQLLLDFELNQPQALSLSYSIDSVSVDSGMDGSIAVDISGGTPPYLFIWSNGSSSDTLNNLPYGQYELTVYDANACFLSESIHLPYNGNYLSYDLVINSIECYGLSTGSIELLNIIGVEPIEFIWSNGASSSSLENLPAGLYQLTVQAGNGDLLFEEVLINQAPALIVNSTIIPVDPQNSNLGSIQLSIQGGNPPYELQWSNGETGLFVSQVDYGPYSVSIRDFSNCELTENIFMDLSILPNWTFDSFGDYHEIVVPEDALMQVNGNLLSRYDFIGVFYDSMGQMACGGYMVWLEENGVIYAHGDRVNTIEKDGFAEGDVFKVSIWKALEDRSYPASAIYKDTYPNTDFWQWNGLSCIESIYSVSIGGSVIDSTELGLPSGWVVFYEQRNDIYLPVGKTNIVQGVYEMEGLLPGNYLAHAIPTNLSQGWVSAYYKSKDFWQAAIPIAANGYTGGVKIVLPRSETNFPGIHTIGGIIYQENDESYVNSFYDLDWDYPFQIQSNGFGQNMVVVLYDTEMNLLASKLSNSEGIFEFNGLNPGGYFVRVEKAGLISVPILVEIEPEPLSIPWLEFYLQSGIVLSKSGFDLDHGILIYPNPMSDRLVIKANKSLISFRLFNLEGKLLKSSVLKRNQHEIDVSSLKPSVYIIEIQNENGRLILSKKLIK